MTWTLANPGDVCKAQSTPHAFGGRPGLVLITCILASSLAFVDGSVVNVGLPAIRHSLRADAPDLQWVINAYLLPLSALLLTGGALGDRLGRRSVLIFGVLLFGAGSALCAAAANLEWLLAARALQGAGAALLLPNSLAILGATFTGEARGRAVGTWSAASAATAAVGPVLGGWLIDTFGWREIFLINIPLAAAAIVLAILFVRETRRGQENARLDVRGAVLATISLAAITWGLTTGAGHIGWSFWAVVSIIFGVGLTGAFLWNERTEKDNAMVPLALFETADFIGLTLLTLLLYGALGALLVLVPYLLIQGAGYSGTAAGAALLPFPIILAATSRAMGGIAGRVGSRIPLTVGPTIVAIGFLLLLRMDATTNYWNGVFPAIVTMSIGMAGAVAPLTTAILASVDARHTGSASGLNSAVARTGGLIATALLGGVLAATGQHLFSTFHQAAIACAVASAAAGLAAFLLVPAAAPDRLPKKLT
ncbi:MAG: MFS transporter [Rhizomicrobium sp.]